jgi:hypothetical protein
MESKEMSLTGRTKVWLVTNEREIFEGDLYNGIGHNRVGFLTQRAALVELAIRQDAEADRLEKEVLKMREAARLTRAKIV